MLPIAVNALVKMATVPSDPTPAIKIEKTAPMTIAASPPITTSMPDHARVLCAPGSPMVVRRPDRLWRPSGGEAGGGEAGGGEAGGGEAGGGGGWLMNASHRDGQD